MRTQVRSLASLSGLGIRCCRELWCRPAATAPIRPRVWEPPRAVGASLKRKKKKRIFFEKYIGFIFTSMYFTTEIQLEIQYENLNKFMA